ncbi:MAG: hypothetical protein JWM49_15 [Microbacteriaceae bacterium]|nr:hypothetical protein [Microbacteriaceae bacterium]
MTVRGDADSARARTAHRWIFRNLTWMIPAGGTLITLLSLWALSPRGQFVLIGQLTTPTLQLLAVVGFATCCAILILVLVHRLGRRTDRLLVIDERDLLICESKWFHTSESLVECHGLLVTV